MTAILPGFASIRDQKQPIWLLKTLLRKGTIPHALLFTGIKGIGKRTAAVAFAMACLCENEQRGKKHLPSQSLSHLHPMDSHRPCTRCNTCHRVASGKHPDVIQIDPEGVYIRIGQIRSLCNTLSMKPYENGFRVVLIVNAHQMNTEAGNALLKALEEPPDKTIFLLTATAVSELLPTIVSRCQRIQFNPLTPESIALELSDKKGVDPDSAKLIATLANGSLSRAYEMLQTDFISHRDWVLNALGMQKMISAKIPIWQGLAWSETLNKQKDRVEDALEIIKSWLRDVLIYPFSPDKIVNQDMIDAIKTASQSTSVESLLGKLAAVEKAQKVIGANGNLRLTLDVLAMQLVTTND